MAPGGLLIAITWIAGIWLLSRARSGLPWHAEGRAPGAQEKPRGHSREQKAVAAQKRRHGTGRVAALFGAASLFPRSPPASRR